MLDVRIKAFEFEKRSTKVDTKMYNKKMRY